MRTPLRAAAPVLALTAALAVAGCSSDSSDVPGGAVPAPVSTTPSVSVSSAVSAPASGPTTLIPFYTVVPRSSLSVETLNSTLTELAKLEGVTGTSRTPGRITVDVTAAITDAQRQAVIRQLAALGEVSGVIPSPTRPPR